MDYKKIFLLFIVAILVLAGMIWFVGPEGIYLALESSNKFYVLTAILLQFLIMALWTSRWGILCTELQIKYNKLQLFGMLLVGLAINNITPSGRGGGEPVRAYLLNKSSKVPFRQTFASVLGDKLLDTFPFLVLAVISIIYLIYYLHMSQTMYVSLIVALIVFLVLCVFLLYICVNEELGYKTVKWIFRQLRKVMSRDLDSYEQKILSAITDFQKNVRYLIKNRRVLTEALAISFLVWFLELLRVYVVFLAFGTHVSLGIIAAVFIVSALVGMIPALPGGLGAIDGLMTLLYSMAGVSTSICMAVTLIERLISYWMVSGLGLLCIPYFGTEIFDEI